MLQGCECLLAGPFVAVLVGMGELAWGRVRVMVTFLLGHVGASLLVFAGLAAGLAAHLVCPRLAAAPVVGVSYGTMAVLGRRALLEGQNLALRREGRAVGVSDTRSR